VLIGTQGAGKSTYSKFMAKRMPKYKRIAKDDVRELIFHPNVKFDDHFHLEILVTQIQSMMIEAAVLLSLTPLIDNNNHTKEERLGLLWHLRYHYPDCRIKAVYVYAPIEKCLARNKQRPGKANVPENIVIDFNNQMKESFGGTDDPHEVCSVLGSEGFDETQVIHPETIDNIRMGKYE
jgi:predicted kinase